MRLHLSWLAGCLISGCRNSTSSPEGRPNQLSGTSGSNHLQQDSIVDGQQTSPNMRQNGGNNGVLDITSQSTFLNSIQDIEVADEDLHPRDNPHESVMEDNEGQTVVEATETWVTKHSYNEFAEICQDLKVETVEGVGWRFMGQVLGPKRAMKSTDAEQGSIGTVILVKCMLACTEAVAAIKEEIRAQADWPGIEKVLGSVSQTKLTRLCPYIGPLDRSSRITVISAFMEAVVGFPMKTLSGDERWSLGDAIFKLCYAESQPV